MHGSPADFQWDSGETLCGIPVGTSVGIPVSFIGILSGFPWDSAACGWAKEDGLTKGLASILNHSGSEIPRGGILYIMGGLGGMFCSETWVRD